MILHVDECWVELFSKPLHSRKNWITSIPKGHEVRLIKKKDSWLYIGTFFQNAYLEGYAFSNRLRKGTYGRKKISKPSIPQIHPETGLKLVVMRDSLDRNLPINDPAIPKIKTTSIKCRVSGLLRLLDFLDVENNARYKSANGHTYCHIYVQDFAALFGSYLPRIWWDDQALSMLYSGRYLTENKLKSTRLVGARTLYDWLFKWGTDFGWNQVFSADKIQDLANKGYLCLLAARRKSDDDPGHICLIVPETANASAVRKKGRITTPLMSHAGNRNRKFFTKEWWTNPEFQFYGFWVAI